MSSDWVLFLKRATWITPWFVSKVPEESAHILELIAHRPELFSRMTDSLQTHFSAPRSRIFTLLRFITHPLDAPWDVLSGYMTLIASINSEIRPDCCRFTLSVSCGIGCCYWSVLFRVQRDTFYQESQLMQGSWFSASFAYWTSQSTELETMQFPLGIIQLFFNRFVAHTFFFSFLSSR